MFDNFRLLAVKVFALHQIVAEIVEFAGKGIRRITPFLLEPLGFMVAVAAWGPSVM